MTDARRSRVGVPLGVAAVVALAIIATFVTVQNRPDSSLQRLPIGLAAGSRAAGATSGEDSAAPAMWGGTTTYRFAAGSTDGLPTSGPAYRLSTGQVARATVERLAGALSVKGEPERVDGAWVVQADERTLRVSDDAGGMWWLEFGQQGCVVSSDSSTTVSSDGSTSSSGSETATSEPCEKPQPVPAPGTIEPMPPESAPPPSPAPEGDPSGPPPEDPAEPAPTDDGQVGICQEGVESPCNASPSATAPEPAKSEPGSEPSSGGGTSGSSGSSSTTSYGYGWSTASGVGYACPVVDCPAGSECTPSPCPTPTPIPLPPEEKAREIALSVAEASGLSSDAVDVRAMRGYDVWDIDIAPRIGGLPTYGLSVHVAIDKDSAIRYANGSLGAAELADTYPLLTPEDAVKRLQTAYPAIMEPQIACDANSSECLAEPKEIVRDVTSVRLGLLFAPGVARDGDAFLVPAWLLTFAEGDYEEPVIALPDAYLAPPPTAEPCTAETCIKGEPDAPPPARTEPGGVPGSEPVQPDGDTAVSSDGG